MMRNNSSPGLLMCPRHSNISGTQNQPRSRNPLMQCCCCLQTEANHPWLPDTGQRRQSLDNARYAEMMRKNIKIPPNYYMSTDPRTLPAEVIKQFASSTGELGPRRLVARSSSSVTVRRAQCVRLRTNRVKRATSFSENILAQYRQYSVANNIIINNNSIRNSHSNVNNDRSNSSSNFNSNRDSTSSSSNNMWATGSPRTTLEAT